MKNYHVAFKVGDVVEATGKIRRVDGMCQLRSGDRARVIAVSRTISESPQIIAVELPNGFHMIDIVCFEDVPLKIIETTPEAK